MPHDSKFSLVICEKHQVAKKIADVLGSKKIEKIKYKKTFYYYVTDINNKNYIILFSNGHLYELNSQLEIYNFTPVFDLSWKPVSIKVRSNVQDTIELLSILAKNTERFIHACDYDQEGELIGYNLLEYACGSKYLHALRAKFSALTEDEIKHSFENLIAPNRNLALSGIYRHIFDFFYGINLSRELSKNLLKLKIDNKSKFISIGRIQGPTLNFIVENKFDRDYFISSPYWNIFIIFRKNGVEFKTENITVTKQSEASKIFCSCLNKDGIVKEIKKKNIQITPPPPFNLSDLLKEAFRIYKFNPSYVLELAEKLYLNSFISYPRTDSQTLGNIDLKPILNKLLADHNYYEIVKTIISKDDIIKYSGTKTDHAHPAIHPTGNLFIKTKRDDEYKIYDLIVRRFLSSISIPLNKICNTASILVNNQIFLFTNSTIKNNGWMDIYDFNKSVSNLDSGSNLKIGDKIKNIKIVKQQRVTQPPPEYNHLTLLQKLEDECIGTKSTRPYVVEILLKRKYIDISNNRKNTFSPTRIGMLLIQYLNSISNNIISPSMTKKLENHLLDIQSGTFTFNNYVTDIKTIFDDLSKIRYNNI